MLKVVMLLKRRPGLSLAEFIEHYETVHAPLAERFAGELLRYERHYLHPLPVAPGTAPEPEYDVVTELWYADREAFDRSQRAAREHPERLAEIAADEEALFDRAKTRVAWVEDRVSDLRAASSPPR